MLNTKKIKLEISLCNVMQTAQIRDIPSLFVFLFCFVLFEYHAFFLKINGEKQRKNIYLLILTLKFNKLISFTINK